MTRGIVMSLPYPYLYDALAERLALHVASGAIHLVQWSPKYPDDTAVNPEEIDLLVLPYHTTAQETTEQYVSTEVLRQTRGLYPEASVVQALSIGVEGLEDCLPAGAVLCNSRGVMELPTAELAVSLLLAATRAIPRFVRTGSEWDNHRTPGLIGSRVLLVGYGGVGGTVEQLLTGFSVDIARVGRRGRTLADGTEVHAFDELLDLLPNFDAVVCSLPETSTTRGMLGRSHFAAMPDGATFVNVGRGSVVNTADLRSEARTGRLRFALDVTDPEPLPSDDALWQLPNVLITPHVGGNSAASLRFQVDLLAEQARRLMEGEDAKNAVSFAM